MIQLANYEARTFYVMLGKVVTSVDVTFTFQMTEQTFTATLVPVSSTLRATKFTFTATGYPEGQYQVQFVETGQTTVLAQVAGFVTGNPIFATSQYNTYNDDGTSTTYVPSDDQGLVPSVSQKLRVSTVNQTTDVSYVRYIKVTNGTLTDNGDNSVTITTGAGSLEEITDVLITGTPINQFLQYDGITGFWKNVTLTLATLADTKGTPVEGKFLKYTGGFWQPSDVDVNLGTLGDVNLAAQAANRVLMYDSTSQKWIASNVPLFTLTGSGLSQTYTNNVPTLTLNAALFDLNNVQQSGGSIASGSYLTWNSNGYWTNTAPPSPPVIPVTSVNTQTGDVVLDADDISDATTTNKFTTAADISKLAGIAAGAEVNVQSDWTATSGDAFILNKPTIPTSLDELGGNLDDIQEGQTNKHFTAQEKTLLSSVTAGAEPNVNADWNAVSGDAQILNKPSIPSAIGDLSDVPATMGTAGQLLVVNSAGTALEYVAPSAQVVTVTAATTLSSTHANKYIVVNSASAVNITVPASATYDAYAEFIFEQYGAGQITIVADTGVTINSSETLKSAAQYAVIGLKRVGSNQYTLTGERELV